MFVSLKIRYWIQIFLLWAILVTGVVLAAWTDIQDHRWLQSDPDLPWSMGNISDAQRRTLLWMGVFFGLTILTWRGIPYGLQTRNPGTNAESITVLRLPILWPVKYLTVLFHEVSHAVVGIITGGKVTYIGVQANENGETNFDEHHRWPNLPITYAAGYGGSCLIGCCLLIAGFDTLASKFASIALTAWITLCMILCAAVNPRLFVAHQALRVTMLCRGRAAIRRYREQISASQKGETYESRMVSLDTVLFAFSFFVAVLGLTWYLYDSMYVRYVLIFMGVASSTYAIRDAWEQGILKSKSRGEDGCSDFEKMARHYNQNAKGNRQRSPAFYARLWFGIQISFIGLAIVIGLAAIKYTTAEQIVRSRRFVPTPHPYHSSENMRAQWGDWEVASPALPQER